MKKHHSLLLLPICMTVSLAITHAALAQDGEERWTSVQFVNAASVESVSMEVNGALWHEMYAPGETISGGKFSFSNWKMVFTPVGEDKAALNFSQTLPNRASAIAILVGDFQLPPEDEEDQKPRAALLVGNTAMGAEDRPNRIRLVNGFVDQPISVSLPGKAVIVVPPLEMASESGFGTKVAFTAKTAGSESASVSLLFLPTNPSVTVAFFPQGDNEIGVKAVNEVNIDEKRELTPAQELEIERLIEEDMKDAAE